MTEQQYNFLTSREMTDSSKIEEVFNECRSFGWCAGFDHEGKPVLTKRGVAWIKDYKNSS